MLSGVRPPELPCAALVVEREVGPDHLPALAAVARAMHVLAADVDRVVVVRRDVERRVPHEAVLHAARPARSTAAATPRRCGTAGGPPRSARRCRRPSPSPTRSTRRSSSRSDRASPSRSRRRPPSATSRAGSPRRARPCTRRVARPAVRRLVLLVAEHVVRNLVVDRDVVDLRVEQALPVPGPAAVLRDREALVVRDDLPVRVGRIDPDVVMVAARRLRRPASVCDRGAAVDRLGVRRREEVGLVLVVGRDRHARVVVRAAHRVAVAR